MSAWAIYRDLRRVNESPLTIIYRYRNARGSRVALSPTVNSATRAPATTRIRTLDASLAIIGYRFLPSGVYRCTRVCRSRWRDTRQGTPWSRRLAAEEALRRLRRPKTRDFRSNRDDLRPRDTRCITGLDGKGICSVVRLPPPSHDTTRRYTWIAMCYGL